MKRSKQRRIADNINAYILVVIILAVFFYVRWFEYLDHRCDVIVHYTVVKHNERGISNTPILTKRMNNTLCDTRGGKIRYHFDAELERGIVLAIITTGILTSIFLRIHVYNVLDISKEDLC